MSIIILITFILSVLFRIKGYFNLKNSKKGIIKNKNKKEINNKIIKNNPSKKKKFKKFKKHLMTTNDESNRKIENNSKINMKNKNDFLKSQKKLN